MSHVDHIRSYYEALNTGDADAVAAHFTEDAVHYYTRLGPHEGAEAIGRFAALGVESIDAQWYVENAIEQGDQVVRAYHHGGKKNPQGDLLGFDHEGRGHTMLEDWTAPATADDRPGE